MMILRNSTMQGVVPYLLRGSYLTCYEWRIRAYTGAVYYIDARTAKLSFSYLLLCN